MWMLIIIAVSITDPSDIPGKIMIKFDEQAQCEKVKNQVHSWLKYNGYKVTTQCKKS